MKQIKQRQLKHILGTTATRLDAALQHTRVTIVNLDRDLRYISVINPVEGFGPADIIGKTIAEVHGEQQAPVIERARRSVIDTGEPYHDIIEVHINGEDKCYDTTTHPTFDADGNVAGITVVSVDLTDLVRARHSLAEANDRLLKVLESTLDPA